MQHQQYHLLKLVDTSSIPYHLPFNCTLYSQVSSSSLQNIANFVLALISSKPLELFDSVSMDTDLLFARCATSIPAAKYGHVAHPRSLSIESSAKQLYGHGSGRNLNKRGPAQDSFISVWCERKSSMMSNDTRPLRWGHWVTPGCFPT